MSELEDAVRAATEPTTEQLVAEDLAADRLYEAAAEFHERLKRSRPRWKGIGSFNVGSRVPKQHILTPGTEWVVNYTITAGWNLIPEVLWITKHAQTFA